MMNWQKKRLSDGSNIGDPDNLPLDLQGLADESLADLGWTDEALGYCGFGYVPVVNLPVAKAEKWALAKRRRNQAIDAGVNVSGVGRFDTDDASRSNITGAVVGAMIAQAAAAPFSIGWKLADNSVATLNGPKMVQAGMAALAHVSACHANAQAIGLAIEAAADMAELDAIDIEAGWL